MCIGITAEVRQWGDDAADMTCCVNHSRIQMWTAAAAVAQLPTADSSPNPVVVVLKIFPGRALGIQPNY